MRFVVEVFAQTFRLSMAPSSHSATAAVSDETIGLAVLACLDQSATPIANSYEVRRRGGARRIDAAPACDAALGDGSGGVVVLRLCARTA